MEDFEGENPKNLYVIRRKLSTYGMLPGEESWSFNIGRYLLTIAMTSDDHWRVTDNLAHREAVKNYKIIDFEKFDIYLYEHDRRVNPTTRAFIDLRQDPRFKDHKPSQSNTMSSRLRLVAASTKVLARICHCFNLWNLSDFFIVFLT